MVSFLAVVALSVVALSIPLVFFFYAEPLSKWVLSKRQL